MGIFTWTDAAVKDPKMDKHYEYADKDVVLYGGYAKLICPDDTEIETESHGYYGCIGGYDIYSLVVDWNKEFLPELLKGRKELIVTIAQMYKDGASEDEIRDFIIKERGENFYLVQDWKRNIGIAIAGEDEDARKLPFPIKLTKDRNAHGYKNLYISYSTQ